MQLEPLQHQVEAVAQQVHRVLAQAYAQEARLLGLSELAPMQRSVADLQADPDAYLGARLDGELAGALAFGPDPEGGQLLVSVLVVAPAFQRRGVARALMRHVLELAGPWPVAVATAQANTPAVLLYESLGFVAYRQGSVGPDALPIVKLRSTGHIVDNNTESSSGSSTGSSTGSGTGSSTHDCMTDCSKTTPQRPTP